MQEELEEVQDINFQLQRLGAQEEGAMGVLRGIQVRSAPCLCCYAGCPAMLPADSRSSEAAALRRPHQLAVMQDELVELRHMKPKADAALQQKSAAQAARAARRHKTEARKEFRSAITPNGLQVSHFPELLH